MKVVLDENIDSELVSLLRNNGYEVVWISDEAPSIDDWQVLERAFALGVLLITEDKGISRDIYEHRRPTAGVPLLRVHGLTFAERAKLVLVTLQENGPMLMGKFSVPTDRRLRIRSLE